MTFNQMIAQMGLPLTPANITIASTVVRHLGTNDSTEVADVTEMVLVQMAQFGIRDAGAIIAVYIAGGEACQSDVVLRDLVLKLLAACSELGLCTSAHHCTSLHITASGWSSFSVTQQASEHTIPAYLQHHAASRPRSASSRTS